MLQDTKQFLSVSCAAVIRQYVKMGGVDIADPLMKYYRIFLKTKKWTVKAIYHFVDIAVCKSWQEYRKDAA